MDGYNGIEILYTKEEGYSTQTRNNNFLSPSSISPDRFKFTSLSSKKMLTESSVTKQAKKRMSQIYQ